MRAQYYSIAIFNNWAYHVLLNSLANLNYLDQEIQIII